MRFNVDKIKPHVLFELSLPLFQVVTHLARGVIHLSLLLDSK